MDTPQRSWATFPEANPNIVVECDTRGQVRYANPVALSRFPDLVDRGWRHPLLAGVHELIGGFATGREAFVAREVDLGDAVFEQKIIPTAVGDEVHIRIYVSDVTALRRAEEAVQDLARRIVVAQEEERHRVSRELHDEAGQALAALKISLQLLRDDLADGDESTRAALADAASVVDETREQLRLIARDLRPPVLDGLGLDMALDGFCADFARRTGLDVVYVGSPDVHATDAVEMCIYRIVQEALANVATHAAARSSSVELRRDDEGCLTLVVSDDGVGIDPDMARDASGIGLAGMRERVAVLHGSFVIDSVPGAGTRLTVRLPPS